MLNVALIGYGYWGKNIARVFSQSQEFDLHTICDSNTRSLENAAKLYPKVKLINDYQKISDDVDVVAIITPTETHFPLAHHFLQNGKHVLLTKPFTKTFNEAETLIGLARKKGLTVFVDHTFLFHPAVRKMKELLPKVGTPYFVLAQRLNLGLYQPDVNVVYDLMPHDVSIISYLFQSTISKCHTAAFRAAGLPQEDIAHSSFELEDGLKGYITVSWLAPAKIREFIIVGSNGMLVYDDVAISEKIKLYDRGITLEEMKDPNSLRSYTSRISYRNGDLYSPAIANVEALGTEISEFALAIEDAQVRENFNTLNLRIARNMENICGATAAMNVDRGYAESSFSKQERLEFN